MEDNGFIFDILKIVGKECLEKQNTNVQEKIAENLHTVYVHCLSLTEQKKNLQENGSIIIFLEPITFRIVSRKHNTSTYTNQLRFFFKSFHLKNYFFLFWSLYMESKENMKFSQQ